MLLGDLLSDQDALAAGWDKAMKEMGIRGQPGQAATTSRLPGFKAGILLVDLLVSPHSGSGWPRVSGAIQTTAMPTM